MSQILLLAAGTIILMMGTGHLLLTLRDVRNPTSFTPTDDSVRLAMKNARLKFSRRVNLWDAWLGFNISHSLGAMMAGGALLFAALAHPDAFLASTTLKLVAVLIPAIYLLVAIRFWFRGPVIGLSVVLLCVLGAVL